MDCFYHYGQTPHNTACENHVFLYQRLRALVTPQVILAVLDGEPRIPILRPTRERETSQHSNVRATAGTQAHLEEPYTCLDALFSWDFHTE